MVWGWGVSCALNGMERAVMDDEGYGFMKQGMKLQGLWRLRMGMGLCGSQAFKQTVWAW